MINKMFFSNNNRKNKKVMNKYSKDQNSCVENTLAQQIQNYMDKDNKYSNVLIFTFFLTVLTSAILYWIMPKVPIFVHILLFFLFLGLYFWLSLFYIFKNIDKQVLQKELQKCVQMEVNESEKQKNIQLQKSMENIQIIDTQIKQIEKMAGGSFPKGENYYQIQDTYAKYKPSNPSPYNDKDFNNEVNDPNLNSLANDNYCLVNDDPTCGNVCSGSPIPKHCSNVYYAVPGPQWQPQSASSMQQKMVNNQWTASTCEITK